VERGDGSAVGVSYLLSPYLNAEDIVSIDNYSSTLPQNLPKVLDKQVQLRGLHSFKIQYKHFLLTHVFYSPAGSEQTMATPLFWRHKLAQDSGDIDISTIKVLDKTVSTEVETPYRVVVESDGTYVYNNLEGYYSSRTGEYQVYFVQYMTTGGASFTEILDNQPIYFRRTLDNLEQVYTYSLSDSGDSFNIDIQNIFPIYAVRPYDKSRIYAKHPLTKEMADTWGIRINNGSFKKSGTFGGEFKTFAYFICDNQFYNYQPFTPLAPYKKAARVVSSLLAKNLISCPITNLVRTDSFPVDIIVKDSKGNLKYVLTTDATKTFYVESSAFEDTPQVVETTQVGDTLSLDRKGGFIYLGPYSLDLDDTVMVTAFYSEDSFVFPELEFNPVVNPSTVDTTVFFVVLSYDYGNPIDYDRNLFWFRLDANGTTIECSDPDDPYCAAIYTYLQTHTYVEFLYNYTSSGVTYLVSGDTISLQEYSGPIYVAELTVPPIPSSMDFSDKVFFSTYKETLEEVVAQGDWTLVGNLLYVHVGAETYLDLPDGLTVSYSFEPYNTYQHLVVGEVAINSPVDPHEMGVYDIRVRGGGIPESKTDGAMEINEEVLWYWDIGRWDWHPVPGMSTERIDLPWYFRPDWSDDIEDTEDLTESEDIQSAVEKRQALGDYALKRIWGPRPILVDFSTTSSTISLSFSDEDQDTGWVRYSAYYMKLEAYEDGVWSDPLSGDVDTHLVEITGLDSDTTYLIKLEATATIDGAHWYTIPAEDLYEIKTEAGAS
jgi:hypothetical protein